MTDYPSATIRLSGRAPCTALEAAKRDLAAERRAASMAEFRARDERRLAVWVERGKADWREFVWTEPKDATQEEVDAWRRGWDAAHGAWRNQGQLAEPVNAR